MSWVWESLLHLARALHEVVLTLGKSSGWVNTCCGRSCSDPEGNKDARDVRTPILVDVKGERGATYLSIEGAGAGDRAFPSRHRYGTLGMTD